MESICKLEIHHLREGKDKNLKSTFDLRKVDETKVMRQMMLLHQENYPKDDSRYALQRTHRDTCEPLFRDLLEI